MPTVSQLIEALQKLPQDAQVEVMREESCGYATVGAYAPVDIEYIRILDYTSDSDRRKYPHMAGKIIVQPETE